MQVYSSKGMAYISIAISLLIAAILIFTILMVYKPGKGEDAGVGGSPIDRASKVQCLAQKRRLEIAIQSYLMENGRFPSSLSELKEFSSEEFYCPVTGAPYQYNSQTGKVFCPDHH